MIAIAIVEDDQQEQKRLQQYLMRYAMEISRRSALRCTAMRWIIWKISRSLTSYSWTLCCQT